MGHGTIPDFTSKVIAGRYHCIGKVGSGAFGAVYRAVEFNPPFTRPRQLAIKIICRLSPSCESPQGTFQISEIQARELTNHGAVSSHPNVVTLHETFFDEKFIYLVLDFCHSNLYTLLSDVHPFWRDDAKVKDVFLQLLAAVDHMHSKSIFHRDLKPENILCSADGENVYVTDFGLSTNSSSSISTGCGSQIYMSPECVGDDFDHMPYSPRHTDIWSLGIILVNMLFVRHPWSIATSNNPDFGDYLTDTDSFFLHMFPISKQANRLLCRMLDPTASHRMSIGAIRIAVENIDTFFMTDEELNGPLGTQYNRKIARHFGASVSLEDRSALPAPKRSLQFANPPSNEIDLTSAFWRQIFEQDSESESGYSRVDTEYSQPSAPRHGEQSPLGYNLGNVPLEINHEGQLNTKENYDEMNGARLPIDNRLVRDGDFVVGSLSSGSESSGPITPPTNPTDPDIVIDEDIPPLTNPHPEVDLGEERGCMMMDVMLPTAPPHVEEPGNNAGIKNSNRKWFVRDFRKLRQLARA